MPTARITPVEDRMVNKGGHGEKSTVALQDGDDGLALAPSHLLCQPDARHQIACAARPEEKAVMLNKVARHRDCLGVRDPIQQKKKKDKRLGSACAR